MKLSLLPVKVLLRKKPKFKSRRKNSKSEHCVTAVTHRSCCWCQLVFCFVPSVLRVCLVVFLLEKAARPKPSPPHCGKMEPASGTEGEINDSTSSMSCFNEFETYAHFFLFRFVYKFMCWLSLYFEIPHRHGFFAFQICR